MLRTNQTLGSFPAPFFLSLLFCLLGGTVLAEVEQTVSPEQACKNILIAISQGLKGNRDLERQITAIEKGTEAIMDLWQKHPEPIDRSRIARAFEMKLQPEAVQIESAEALNGIAKDSAGLLTDLQSFNEKVMNLKKELDLLPKIVGTDKRFTRRDSVRFAGKDIQQVTEELKIEMAGLYKEGQGVSEKLKSHLEKLEQEAELVRDMAQVYIGISSDLKSIGEQIEDFSESKGQIGNLATQFGLAGVVLDEFKKTPESMVTNARTVDKLVGSNLRTVGYDFPNQMRALQVGTLYKTIVDITERISPVQALVPSASNEGQLADIQARIEKQRNDEQAQRQAKLDQIRKSIEASRLKASQGAK